MRQRDDRKLCVGRLDAHRRGDLRAVGNQLRVVGECGLWHTGRTGRQFQQGSPLVASRRGMDASDEAQPVQLDGAAAESVVVGHFTWEKQRGRRESFREDENLGRGSAGIDRHDRRAGRTAGEEERHRRGMIAGGGNDELIGLEAGDPRQLLGMMKVSAPDLGRRQGAPGSRRMNEEPIRTGAVEGTESREDLAHAGRACSAVSAASTAGSPSRCQISLNNGPVMTRASRWWCRRLTTSGCRIREKNQPSARHTARMHISCTNRRAASWESDIGETSRSGRRRGARKVY